MGERPLESHLDFRGFAYRAAKRAAQLAAELEREDADEDPAAFRRQVRRDLLAVMTYIELVMVVLRSLDRDAGNGSGGDP